MPRTAHLTRSAMCAASVLALIGMANPAAARADVFGLCPHQRNLEDKIAACIQATKSTSYPWILQWVHRELARAQRERGELQEVIFSLERSLAAEEREEVQRELEALILSLTQSEKLRMRAATGHQR